MAALIEGQQYGLSAQDRNNSNKSIVFVKLTDSALRSIEEYVKNKGGTDSKPTIQFQNSNGILSLPHNGTNLTYGFTLSNVEADGPQGSFECLRQNRHKSLESLGCMHMKMHIHANEDSYENTRVKMAAVEKEKKGSCTKVIKPAGAHLGRKVKVKQPAPVVNPVKPYASPPSASTINKNPPHKLMNGISNGSSNVVPPKKLPEVVNKYQNHKPPPPPQPSKSKFTSSPELLRQPIRDRIIHILAVRPYKRPELMVRLMSEGIRDKDKKGITAILSQVGVLKGNIYNIANYCWNEVQDNWKFCTKEELEIIRRRKQQSLSANESPPTVTNPSTSPAQKRVANETYSVGQEPRAKKLRISHYNRTEIPNSSVKVESTDSNDRLNFTTTTISKKNTFLPGSNTLDQDSVSSSAKVNSFSPIPVSTNGTCNEFSPKSSDNSCDGFNFVSQRNSVGSHPDDALSSSSLNLRNASREDSEKNIRKHTNGLGQHGGKYPDKPFHKSQQLPTKSYEVDKSIQKHSSFNSKSSVNSDTGKSFPQNKTLSHERLTDSLYESSTPVSPDSNTPFITKDLKSDSCSKNGVNGYSNSSIRINGYNSSYVNGRSKVTSTTNGSLSASPHSPESDSNDSIGANSPVHDPLNQPPTTPESDPELPDFTSQYVRVISHDQRTRYKEAFNEHYQEYLYLHSQVEKVRKSFKSLEDHLSHYQKGSKQFNKISSIITEEYRAYNEDENFKKTEEKYNYLHRKLSHIKKLVMDYDKNSYFKS